MCSQKTTHFIRVNESPILMTKTARSTDTSLPYHTISQNSPNFTAIPAPTLSSRFSCNITPYWLETVTQVSEERNVSMFRANLGLPDPQYGVCTLFRNNGNCYTGRYIVTARIPESSLTVLQEHKTSLGNSFLKQIHYLKSRIQSTENLLAHLQVSL
jgi:hypothetical protein